VKELSMVSAIDPTKPLDGVPAVKADLRSNLAAAKSEIEALQARKIEDGMSFDMRGAVLANPVLKSYAENILTPEINGGTLTLDLAAGTVFQVTLTQNVTSMALVCPAVATHACSAVLVLTQDATGGRTVEWPGSVKWPRGTPPAVTNAAKAIDIYTFVTADGGATWYGFAGGQDFS
jgi:hypothetical protein